MQNSGLDEIRTVGIFLGPYRNFTTLTASLLFLHPSCQVLNHAAGRILGNESLDFIAGYSEEKFQAFLRFAISASEGGRNGDFGGSITHSHAFLSHDSMREAHRNAGSALVKPEIHALVWKDSLQVSNYLRQNKTDLDALFSKNKKLRFIMPVRNPLDCAMSNLFTARASYFQGLESDVTLMPVLKAVLEEHLWFEQCRKCYPDKFFNFFQDEINQEETFVRLARYLELDAKTEWLANVRSAWELKGRRYKFPPKVVEQYRQMVVQAFSAQPEFSDRLLALAENALQSKCQSG